MACDARCAMRDARCAMRDARRSLMGPMTLAGEARSSALRTKFRVVEGDRSKKHWQNCTIPL
eukprot:scaffold471_cov235-Pinguiococcus_pyrenoidosus.AAC.5